MPASTPKADLERFIARFTPEIAALARGALKRMRKRIPTAHQLVYDNYNGLGIGFAASERASTVIFSIVLYPRRVTLFFMQAQRSKLDDPDGLLRGSGTVVRHVPLDSAAMLDSAPLQRLMAQALERAQVPLSTAGKGRLIIKSIAAKRRPRRP
jgi:hypothetical protein